jgi:uncharacterized membrane protein HdeD (DUF308 family)
MQAVNSQVQEITKAIPRGLAIRGVVAIAFGVLILVNPSISLSALVLLVGAFAAVDGVTSLGAAFLPMQTTTRLLFIANGIAGLVVAAITVTNPGITELALLYLVGIWAIVVGVVQFMVAFGAPIDTGARVLSFVYGVVSVAFGAIMFIQPGTGALGLLSLISAYAIVTGVILIGAAWEFRSAANEVKQDVTNALNAGNTSANNTAAGNA